MIYTVKGSAQIVFATAYDILGDNMTLETFRDFRKQYNHNIDEYRLYVISPVAEIEKATRSDKWN